MSSSRSTPRLGRRSLWQAWALEPRMMFDAAAVATAEQVVDATESQPGVTATGVEASITVDDGSGTQSVDLFSDVSVASATDSEALSDLVVTVDSAGSNQALVIDGTSIALVVGSGVTSENYYSYQVTVSGGVTRITLSIASSEASSEADIASLIDGIAYQTVDNTVESGTITVTLATLSDDSETATLDISSSITIDNTINVAPTLSDDRPLASAESIALSDLGDDAQVTYSDEGDYAYVAGEGSVSVFTVDDSGRLTLVQTLSVADMGTATEIVSSSDGLSLYVTDGSSAIYVFSIEDGGVSLASTVTYADGYISGGLAISDDGSWVYAGTDYNDVVIFSRDTTTGELTYLTRAPGESDSSGRNGVIATSGDYVYVIYTNGSHAILVYQRADDGSLSTVATLTTDIWGFSAVDYSLAVSEDGQYLYVADPDYGTLSLYQFSDASLTLVETFSLEGVTDIALSSDGGVLYATTSGGSIYVYSVSQSGGTLTLVSSVSGGDVGDIAVSSDGLSLLIAGSSGVTRYSAAQTLAEGASANFASGMTLADSNNDVLNAGEGNYNGTSITVSANVDGGTFGMEDGDGLTYADGVISFEGSAIATLATSSDGSLTVTFTADVATDVANQVLQQLTYRNSAAVVGSYILLTVAVNDGQLASNNQVVTLRVNALPTVNASVSADYELESATSETDYSFTLSSDLFSDADGDNLTWSVTGLPDGLSFDAATHTISGAALETGTFTVTVTVADASGASASLELTLEVAQIANRAPALSEGSATSLASATDGAEYSATLDDSLFSDADSLYGDSLTWTVSGLPDGLVFDPETLTISGSSSAVDDYTLTVTVTDESGASSSHEMTLRVITTEEASNNAPSLIADSSDLIYTSDGSLSGFNQYVNSITLSDDGGILVIAASTSSNANGPNGTSSLYVYSRDTTTGELTLLQTFTQGLSDDGDDSNGIEADGLQAITSVTYSADGSLLYVTGYSSTGSSEAYSITVFSVGDDGALSLVGSVADLPETVLQIAVSDNGDTLYALSSSTLYAYSIGSEGTLTAIDTYAPDSGFGTAVAMQVDEDGNVYVLSSQRLTLYTQADDGTVSYVGQLTRSGNDLVWTDAGGVTDTIATLSNSNAFSGANALVVSDTGAVYLTTSNGFLTTLQYDSASGTLSLVSAISAYDALYQYPHSIAISDDGTTLYVTSAASNIIAVYTIGEEGAPALSGTITTDSAISRLVVSADGLSIYGGRHMYGGTLGLNIISATSVSVAYSERETITPASGLTLADAEYDALNDGAGNYKGAVITLARDGEADSADIYGFSDGNGLTLTNGVLSLDGEAIATVAITDGALTLTFTADVSTGTANQVLNQLTYTNTSNQPDSAILLTLSVADRYTTSSVAIQLTVSAVNNAPSVTATAVGGTYTEDGEAVALFGDVTISTIESDQTIVGLTLTVSGLVDGESETLVVDGTTVTLTDGATGSTTSGYVYTVTLSDDGSAAVVVSSSDGMTSDAAAALLSGLAYANSSDNPGEGTRTVSISAIQDNGGTDNGGSDTTELAIAATVTVQGVNDAPELDADAAEVDYATPGEESAALFSDVVVSTVDSNQSIIGISVTVSGVLDGSSETLNIDGTAISLVEGSGDTTSGYHWEAVINNEGVVTLTITSQSGIDTASLINSLSYANANADQTAGARTVTLVSVTDNGGTANGGRDTAALAIAATVNVLPVNNTPIVIGTGNTVGYTEGESAVTLFDDIAIDVIETEQVVNSVTLTVSGVSEGASETLTIDGAVITLVDGEGTTASGYAWAVAVNDGVVTLTLSAPDGISDAATLLNNIAYANLSDNPTEGIRTVTLASVQDNGGGADTATLNITATVTVLAVNDAPQLNAPAPILAQATQGNAYSATLSDALFSDADNTSLSWQVTGLPDGLLFDADSLTISGTPAESGSFTLTVIVTDAQGAQATLTLPLTVAQRAVNPVIPMASSPFFDPLPLARIFAAMTDGEALRHFSAPQPESSPTPDAAFNVELSPGMAAASVSPLATGPMDYAATTWALDPIMPGIMPVLENVDFTAPARTTVANAHANGEPPVSEGRQVYRLADNGNFVAARLANGRPLPEWLQFDPLAGELSVNVADAPPVGQIQVLLTQADGETQILTLPGTHPISPAGDARIPAAAADAEPPVRAIDTLAKPAFSQILAAERGNSDALLKAARLMTTPVTQAGKAS
ncbi:putative Ig domain-containing protein [Klebsiella indica]|uniref:putative Ig domain-containing protein n=1 Tax=Klebsiella TaxID=570 RepID=UPI0037521E35